MSDIQKEVAEAAKGVNSKSTKNEIKDVLSNILNIIKKESKKSLADNKIEMEKSDKYKNDRSSYNTLPLLLKESFDNMMDKAVNVDDKLSEAFELLDDTNNQIENKKNELRELSEIEITIFEIESVKNNFDLFKDEIENKKVEIMYELKNLKEEYVNKEKIKKQQFEYEFALYKNKEEFEFKQELEERKKEQAEIYRERLDELIKREDEVYEIEKKCEELDEKMILLTSENETIKKETEQKMRKDFDKELVLLKREHENDKAILESKNELYLNEIEKLAAQLAYKDEQINNYMAQLSEIAKDSVNSKSVIVNTANKEK